MPSERCKIACTGIRPLLQPKLEIQLTCLPSILCSNQGVVIIAVVSINKTLHNGDLMITYLNDNNSVMFLDNDLQLGRENWDFIETQDKRYQGLGT